MSRQTVTFCLVFQVGMLVLVNHATPQDIVINESMASNSSTIADEDGDYEDWIELYNPGSETVDLTGWGLSDNEAQPFRWVFPPVTIDPGAYLLVWASGKNRAILGSPLHTSFSISASGEEVLLTNAIGVRVDEVILPPLPCDLSYGRLPDGEEAWYYFDQPTPGASNATIGYTEILAPPTFSAEGGWSPGDLTLTLSANHPSALILYTLDGSEPHPDAIGGGLEYLVNYFYPGEWVESVNLPRQNQTFVCDGPIFISDRSQEANDLSDIITTYRNAPTIWWNRPTSLIQKATVVRARAWPLTDTILPSQTKTATYLISPDGPSRYTLPVISVVSDANHLLGYEDGVYVEGKGYFDGGGSETAYVYTGNYWSNWEVPIHLELYEDDGSPGLSQNLGMRIHGGGSRSRPMKAFRLYARSEYDPSNLMHYRFFPEETYQPGGALDTYKRILVRLGGNLMNLITDAAVHRIMEPGRADVQKSRPVVHFVNGEYWGAANIRDRQDEYYLAYKYGIDPENIVLLDAPWGLGSSSMVEVGEPDDILLYRELYTFVVGNDMSDPANYAHVQTMIDFQSYIDYNVMFIYLNNIDWYGHKHFRYWRVRETSELPYQDGRWRMMVWDFDSSPRTADFDFLLNFIHPEGGGNGWNSGNPERTALLRNLLENPDFRNLFLNRFADHINSTFRPERISQIVQGVFDVLQPELSEHFTRWGYSGGSQSHVDSWINFANQRPAYQRQHIREHFDISGDIALTVDVSDPQHGHVRVNTIDITPETPGIPEATYPWTGIYFENIPVTVTAV
ncbi:MAG: CotH kinase family protein, partial [Phycisphaerae bacterium]|nr:CotH kinase family protein [Phycisphaerae bacterium]